MFPESSYRCQSLLFQVGVPSSPWSSMVQPLGGLAEDHALSKSSSHRVFVYAVPELAVLEVLVDQTRTGGRGGTLHHQIVDEPAEP